MFLPSLCYSPAWEAPSPGSEDPMAGSVLGSEQVSLPVSCPACGLRSPSSKLLIPKPLRTRAPLLRSHGHPPFLNASLPVPLVAPSASLRAIMKDHTPITYGLCLPNPNSSPHPPPPPHTHLCLSSSLGWLSSASQRQAQPSCPVLVGLKGPATTPEFP